MLAFADDGPPVSLYQHLGGAGPGIVVRGHRKAVGSGAREGQQVPLGGVGEVAVAGQVVAALADGTDEVGGGGGGSVDEGGVGFLPESSGLLPGFSGFFMVPRLTESGRRLTEALCWRTAAACPFRRFHVAKERPRARNHLLIATSV